MGVPSNPPPTPKVKSTSRAPGPDLENDYSDWVEHGIAKGWITVPDCIHHGATDPLPLTAEEEADDLDDPCLVAARFWGPEGRST